MSCSSRIAMVAVCTAVLGCGLVLALGVEKDGQGSPSTRRSLVGHHPVLDSPASYDLNREFNRVIRIKRGDPTDEVSKNVWFCRPLFAFVERTTEIPSYPRLPSIVLDAHSDLPDREVVRLDFKVRTSSEEFRRCCRQRVLDQDPASAGVSTIGIEKWPITHAVIECRLKNHGDLLAVGETGQLDEVGDFLPFSLSFSQGALTRMTNAAISDGLEFEFYYTFSSRQVVTGSVRVAGTLDLKSKIEQILTADQRSGKAPIFQGNLNAVQEVISLSVVREKRNQDPARLALVSDDAIVSHLFQLKDKAAPLNLQGDEALKQAAYKYLEPLVRKMCSTSRTDAQQKDERTHKSTKKVDMSGLEIGTVKFTGGGGFEITDEDKNTLLNEYGVEVRDENSEYVPYSIKVYQLADGWQNAKLDESDISYVATPSDEEAYFQDTAVLSSFTEARVYSRFPREAKSIDEAIAAVAKAKADEMAAEKMKKDEEARREKENRLSERNAAIARNMKLADELKQLQKQVGSLGPVGGTTTLPDPKDPWQPFPPPPPNQLPDKGIGVHITHIDVIYRSSGDPRHDRGEVDAIKFSFSDGTDSGWKGNTGWQNAHDGHIEHVDIVVEKGERLCGILCDYNNQSFRRIQFITTNGVSPKVFGSISPHTDPIDHAGVTVSDPQSEITGVRVKSGKFLDALAFTTRPLNGPGYKDYTPEPVPAAP